MLADLVLSELPIDTLVILKQAVEAEIEYRDTYAQIQYDKQSKGDDNGFSWVACQAGEPFSLPGSIRMGPLSDRMRYLPTLLSQDWSLCFPGAEQERKSFYVYAHIDPRGGPLRVAPGETLKGQPFYIGKGSGRRAWDLKRNQGHAKRIQAIQKAGHSEAEIVHIIADQLTDREALCLEAKLIYFFGSIYDETTAGCLLNLADQAQPIFAMGSTATPPNPLGPTQKIHGGDKVRWEDWQATTMPQRYLPLEAQQNGYTVVRVAPQCRRAFIEMMRLLKTYQSLPPKKQRDLEVLQAWEGWIVWARRLSAYLKRTAAGQPCTLPPPPFS